MQDEMNMPMSQDSPVMGATLPNGEVDHEGAMAKADLYKLANYSFKLFKQIQDGDQLEGWVQAKITKAADYIASVYHYLEYEMKFSEYGEKIENSDMYTESQKRSMKNKLMEAKEKVKDLKKVQADKLNSKKEADSSVTKDKKDKDKKVVAVSKKKDSAVKKLAADKKTTGSTNTMKEGIDDYESEDSGIERLLDMMNSGEIDVEDLRDALARAEERNPLSDTDPSGNTMGDFDDIKTPFGQQKSSSGGTISRDRGVTRHSMKEGAAKKITNDLKSLNDEEFKSAHKMTKSQARTKIKNKKEVDESAKPSTGLNKGQKSATATAAAAGKDIGKQGEGFGKVEKAAAKSGAKDPKAVAAAAMWKNKVKAVKEDAKVSEANKKAKPDFLDVDKDGDKEEPMKKAVADKKETVKESAETTRIRQLMQRLNG